MDRKYGGHRHGKGGGGGRNKYHTSSSRRDSDKGNPGAGGSDNARDPRPGGSGTSRLRGRPPGLRGREIGMYYASLNKKKKQEEKEIVAKKNQIRLDEDRQRYIWQLLGKTSDISNHSSSFKDKQPPERVDKLEEKYDHIADSSFKRQFIRNLEGNRRATLGETEKIRTAIERDAFLDQSLKNELEATRKNQRYIKMQSNRNRLPAASKREEILQLLSKHSVIVISGETGCGKTTQVTQYILDDAIDRGDGSLCRIVCTQPRRISAISVAQRVADERHEPIGKSVGFQIRLESKRPRERGSILYCTTGILLQWLQSDPCLEHVSHLVIDEIHERDTLSDFVITIMKDLLKHRPEMKLVLMSATLNAKSFSHYYDKCPMLNIPGMTFPVETFYLEDVLQKTCFKFSEKEQKRKNFKKYFGKGKEEAKKIEEYNELMEPYLRKLKRDRKYDSHVIDSLRVPDSEEINLDLILSLLEYICNTQPDGAVLIFLPGWDQISKLYNMVDRSVFFTKRYYKVLPLHSSLPTIDQKEIFVRPPKGVRKIVLATNIAETSITIDDVVYVIDCGRIKMTNYDVKNNLQTLKPEWVSLANAVQRRGRAGRVQPGVCYHLFSKRREMILAQYPLPEMLRSRLEEVILQLKILKLGAVRPFLAKVLDPPDAQAVDLSIKLLETLNALDEQENLTPLGFHLARLPMDPQTGKMILLAALFGCVDPVLSVAASLSHKDAFTLPLGQERKVDQKKKELSLGQKSDHLVFAEAMKRWERAEVNGLGRDFCWEYFLSGNTLSMLRNMKRQLTGHLKELNFISTSDPKAPELNVNSSNRSLVKAVICAGLYPNIAVIEKVKIHKSGRVFVRVETAEDGRVEIHPKSVNANESVFESPYLLYHLKLRSSAIYLHDTTMVHPLPLLFFGGCLKSITNNDGDNILKMDFLKFYCKKDTSFLFKELRKRLDALLENKITHPGSTDWTKNSTERDLLQAIVELITTEDKHMMLQPDQCSDDDDDDDY